MVWLKFLDWDLEIRKRYAQPLASESGEFPDTSSIESRMLPICYEVGLTSGHVPEAAHFMAVATETFVKEVLSSIFSKTRSNGPGAAGSVGTGGASSWVQTHRYRLQLEKEEEASLRGDIQRDKSGLLPIEAKAAGERGPLGMADIRTALEIGDCGMGQMPVMVRHIMLGYREGEVEAWNDFTWPDAYQVDSGLGSSVENDTDTEMLDVNGVGKLESDDYGWEGCDVADRKAMDSILDSILAI
jgi:transcriptional coactivator HFI1/ADA1